MYLSKCQEKCPQDILRVVVSRGSECMFPTQIHMRSPYASVMVNKEQYAPTRTDDVGAVNEVLYDEYCKKLLTPLRLLHGELKPLYGMHSLSAKGQQTRAFFVRCLILLRNATQGGINKKPTDKGSIKMSLDINSQYPSVMANCQFVLDFKRVCIFCDDSGEQFPSDEYYVLYYVSSVCYEYPVPCMMSLTHIESLQTCGFKVTYQSRGLAISGVSRRDSGTCHRWKEVTMFCNEIRGRPGRRQLKMSLNILIGFWGKLSEQYVPELSGSHLASLGDNVAIKCIDPCGATFFSHNTYVMQESKALLWNLVSRHKIQLCDIVGIKTDSVQLSKVYNDIAPSEMLGEFKIEIV